MGIDNIHAVPEPSAILLTAVGVLVFAASAKKTHTYRGRSTQEPASGVLLTSKYPIEIGLLVIENVCRIGIGSVYEFQRDPMSIGGRNWERG